MWQIRMQGTEGQNMSIILHRLMKRAPLSLSATDVAEKKLCGDGKWRKAHLAITVFLAVFVLVLFNMAVNDQHIVHSGGLRASLFGESPRNYPFFSPEAISNVDNETTNLHSQSAVTDTKPNDGTETLPASATSSTEATIRLRREGTEALPRGIVESSTDLERMHLWKSPEENSGPQNLVAIAVGIKQKSNVDKIIQKFPADNFTVMLFHYDGKVDEWTNLPWSAQAIHVMAVNQTKWWFAKRFLHPDIVAKYNYLFLWDEDIGVDNFHAGRYLSLMEDEGLEISQPALHHSSQIHHPLTQLNESARVHRRTYAFAGGAQCTGTETGPPCTGWVEMMVPVFSKAAWRCAWHILQSDLVYAWLVDYHFGYCAQGTRSEKVGVIDSEYVVHQGIQSLGGPPDATQVDERQQVVSRAEGEGEIFSQRWRNAAENDKTWIDPYNPVLEESSEVTSDQAEN